VLHHQEVLVRVEDGLLCQVESFVIIVEEGPIHPLRVIPLTDAFSQVECLFHSWEAMDDFRQLLTVTGAGLDQDVFEDQFFILALLMLFGFSFVSGL